MILAGELHALAATSRLWAPYRWVVALSGPDNLLTPHGARWLWARLQTEAAKGNAALLADRFPGPPGMGRGRFSMDLFAFFPRRVGRLWPAVTHSCLRRVTRMPENLLGEVSRSLNLTVKLPAVHSRYPTSKGKLGATRPNGRASWHTHNQSAAKLWLAEQEARLGIAWPGGRRGRRPDCGGGPCACPVYTHFEKAPKEYGPVMDGQGRPLATGV